MNEIITAQFYFIMFNTTFHKVKDQTALAISNQTIEYIIEHNIPVNNCRGQG